MEENKYYTPTIEEFHEGFIYSRLMTNGWSKEREWSYKTTAPLHLVQKEIEKDNIRVKYLDREDIESLGFTYNKGDEVLMSFKKDNICLGYRSKEHTVTIFSMDVNKDEYFLKLNVDRFAVNNITIKNKSELKKLLKQLKIIE